MTQVISVKDAPQGWQDDPQYVYIGRQNPWYKPKHLKRSKWANPFPVENGDLEEYEQAIAQFREHLLNKPELLAQLPELDGKTLVCWCKKYGANAPCHGDVLVELLEAQKGSPE